MIKAVFFDFFNTLAGYEPSREAIYEQTCGDLGITIIAKDIYNTLVQADLFMRDEEARIPIERRSPDEQRAFYTQYINMAFSGCNVQVDSNTAVKIFTELQKRPWQFQVFKDVFPTLQELKSRGLVLGLISNVGKDMSDTYEKLGLTEYLDSCTNSLETGYDKPQKEIFLKATEKCAVAPEESIFVGDQYDIDIVGARNSNMLPLLIDRNNWFAEITDCNRIQSLNEITCFF